MVWYDTQTATDTTHCASCWDASKVTVSTAASLEGSMEVVKSKKCPNLLLNEDWGREREEEINGAVIKEKRKTIAALVKKKRSIIKFKKERYNT